MTLSEMITELDTAVGMLIIMASRDSVVRQAMEKVMNVSIELGELAAEEETDP